MDAKLRVRSVAWRVAASRWRKARNRVLAHGRYGPADPVPGPSEDAVAVTRALRVLPEPQRVAVVLHHLVGLSVDQVAAQTGVPAGTVKARLSRGRTALSALSQASVDEWDRA